MQLNICEPWINPLLSWWSLRTLGTLKGHSQCTPKTVASYKHIARPSAGQNAQKSSALRELIVLIPALLFQVQNTIGFMIWMEVVLGFPGIVRAVHTWFYKSLPTSFCILSPLSMSLKSQKSPQASQMKINWICLYIYSYLSFWQLGIECLQWPKHCINNIFKDWKRISPK